MAKNEPNKPDDMKTVPANETQAEEKTAPGNEPLEAGSEAPAPELTAEEAAALAQEGEAALRGIGEEQLEPPTTFDIPNPGDVVVPFEKINGGKVAGREAVQETKEQEAPAQKEAPAPEDKAPEKKAARKGRPPKAEKADKPDKEPKPEKTPKAEKPARPPKTAAKKEAPAKEAAPAPEPEKPQEPREAPRSGEQEHFGPSWPEVAGFGEGTPQQAVFEFSHKGKSQKRASVLTLALLAV